MKVLVFTEQRNGEFRKAAMEALCEGRRLSASGELVAVIIGRSASGFAPKLAGYGPDRVLCIENPLLEQYSTEGYSTALEAVIKHEKPEVVLAFSY